MLDRLRAALVIPRPVNGDHTARIEGLEALREVCIDVCGVLAEAQQALPRGPGDPLPELAHSHADGSQYSDPVLLWDGERWHFAQLVLDDLGPLRHDGTRLEPRLAWCTTCAEEWGLDYAPSTKYTHWLPLPAPPVVEQ